MNDPNCPSCDRMLKLEGALIDLFAMMDEGLLVRDISKDAEPGWALKNMEFIVRLKKAHDLLKGKAE